VFLLEIPAIDEHKDINHIPVTKLSRNSMNSVKQLLTFLAKEGVRSVYGLITGRKELEVSQVKMECNKLKNKLEKYRKLLSKEAELKNIPLRLQGITQNLIFTIIKANDILNLSYLNMKNIKDLYDNLRYERIGEVILSCNDKVDISDMIKMVTDRILNRSNAPLLLSCKVCKDYLSNKDLLWLVKECAKEHSLSKDVPLEPYLKEQITKVFNQKIEVTNTCIICKYERSEVYGDDKHRFCRECWVQALSHSLQIPNTFMDFRVWPIKCPITNCRATLCASYVFKSLNTKEVNRIIEGTSKRSRIIIGTKTKIIDWHVLLILNGPGNLLLTNIVPLKCIMCQRKKSGCEIKTCTGSDDHYICIDCLKKIVSEAYYNRKGIAAIKCTKENCGSGYKRKLIKEVCDMIHENCYFEMYVQAIEITEQRITLLKCANWKSLVLIHNRSINAIIVCSSCDYITPRIFLRKEHKGVCVRRKEILRYRKGTIIPIICPYCRAIVFKDKRSHFTNCPCGGSCCSVCSAKREPILAHDSSYHRESCIHYLSIKEHDREYGGNYNKRDGCPECKKLGKTCSPPKNLVNFDLPLEESF